MAKTILITGSGSGFGKSAAVELAQRGHKVYATTHHQKDADVLNEFAKKENLPIESFVLDVANAKDRKKILDYKIDVLINNAGIGETGSLAEIDIDRVRQNFEVNVFGHLELTQLVLRQMIPRNSGTIIFVSSLLGRVTKEFFGAYSMTKFAISSGAEILRKELAEITTNVFVSVVEPGAYHTGFNQQMIAKKFEWMDEKSYFFRMKDELEKREQKQFAQVEEKDISSLVNKIIEAAEADTPRLRYVAPWWAGLGVMILRAFGK